MASSGVDSTEEAGAPSLTVGSDRPRQHLAFIHGLRGIAAMLVVWAHLGTMWTAGHGETSFSERAVLKLVVLPFRIYQEGGHLGVVLFFLISGYIITYTSLREDRMSFAVKRILRLVPPFVVAMGAVWLYIRFSEHLGDDPLGVRDDSLAHWARSFFLLDGWFGVRIHEVTWTLIVEVVFYTMTFALLGLSRARPELATWAMSGMWAVVCVVVTAIPALSTSVNGTVPGYVGFLLVGRSIYLWTAGVIRPIVGALNAALALLLFASFTERVSPGLIFGVTSPNAEPIYTYGYALIIFLGLMSWAPRRTLQPFTFLGDVSYSLYLLHVPVGFATFSIVSRLGFPPDLMIASAITTSLLVSWVSYRLVERPSQRLARSLLRRRKKRAELESVAPSS